MAGRPKMPVQAIVANGNKSMLSKEEIETRQAAEDAIKPASDDIKRPTWLDAVGREMWNRIVKELRATDMMTNVDVYALAIACDAYSKFVLTSKAIKKDGLVLEHKNTKGATNRVANPNAALANQYAKMFKSFCSEFGLSPAARARLAKPKDVNEDDEDDDLD